jgi:hypothetical protein
MNSRGVTLIMRIKFIIIVVLTCIILSGCQRIISGIYGVERNPRAKTEEQILDYISRMKMPYKNQYTVDNLGIDFLNNLSSDAPACYLFDKNGNLLRDSNNNGCLKNRIDKFENNIKNEFIIVDTSVTLENVAKYINKDFKLNNENFTGSLMDDNAQYYILLTWAIYLGKFNEIYYQNWYNKVIELQQKYNIKIININTDFLKGLNYDNINYKPRG